MLEQLLYFVVFSFVGRIPSLLAHFTLFRSLFEEGVLPSNLDKLPAEVNQYDNKCRLEQKGQTVAVSKDSCEEVLDEFEDLIIDNRI